MAELNYAKISWGEQSLALARQPSDYWYFVDYDPAELIDGAAVEAIIQNNGTPDHPDIHIETDDPLLAFTITNYIQNEQPFFGSKMYGMYPEVIKKIQEFKSLLSATGFELDYLNARYTFIYNDAFFDTMEVDRIEQWEAGLGLQGNADLSLKDRRNAIKARLLSTFKLNTQSIKDIVATFTDAECVSHFSNSTLWVEVKLPPSDLTNSWPNIEAEIKRRLPAHIGLNVRRYWGSWGDIKDGFASWDALSTQCLSWEAVRTYYVS